MRRRRGVVSGRFGFFRVFLADFFRGLRLYHFAGVDAARLTNRQTKRELIAESVSDALGDLLKLAFIVDRKEKRIGNRVQTTHETDVRFVVPEVRSTSLKLRGKPRVPDSRKRWNVAFDLDWTDPTASAQAFASRIAVVELNANISAFCQQPNVNDVAFGRAVLVRKLPEGPRGAGVVRPYRANRIIDVAMINVFPFAGKIERIA